MAFDRHRKEAKDIMNTYRRITLDASADIYDTVHSALKKAEYEGFLDGWIEGRDACVDYIRDHYGIGLDDSQDTWLDFVDEMEQKKNTYFSEQFVEFDKTHPGLWRE